MLVVEFILYVKISVETRGGHGEEKISNNLKGGKQL